MPTIKIHRNSEWKNQKRKYDIFIDDQKVNTIEDNETKELVVSPGIHSVYLKIDWCSSPKIEINTDNTNTLYVSGMKYGNWITISPMVILAIHLLANFLLHFELIIYLAFPFMLATFYTVTLGRKKYLRLVKEEAVK